MDDHNKPTSETPYGQQEGGSATAARLKLSEKAAEVKERVADFGRKIDEGNNACDWLMIELVDKLAGENALATRRMLRLQDTPVLGGQLEVDI